MVKGKMIKQNYTVAFDRLLWGEILDHCIKEETTLMDFIQESVCSKLGLNRETLLQEETKIMLERGMYDGFWHNLLEQQREKREMYNKVINNNKYKHKSKEMLDKVLGQYSIDDLIKLKEVKEDDK